MFFEHTLEVANRTDGPYIIYLGNGTQAWNNAKDTGSWKSINSNGEIHRSYENS